MTAALKLPPEEKKPRQVGKKTFKTSQLVKYRPAGMGKRFIAFTIDSLIAGALSQIITVFLINKLISGPGLIIASLAFGLIFVPLFYWSYLTINFGGTPGKKMMGLKIISKKGKKLSFGQIYLRESVGRVLSVIFFCLGYLTAFFDQAERRTWHDRLAKTRVVEYR